MAERAIDQRLAVGRVGQQVEQRGFASFGINGSWFAADAGHTTGKIHRIIEIAEAVDRPIGTVKTWLHRARADLGDLVSQIAEQATAVEAIRGRVAAADRRIDVAERALGLVLASRVAVRDELEAAQAAYADAESRLHDTVVDAFMNSPGGLAQADVLGAFLEASSMVDLQDRLADAPRPGRPCTVSGVIDPLIAAVIDADPRDLGYRCTGWTNALLRRYLEDVHRLVVSRQSVQLALARLDICWKRPRHQLARRPDTWRQSKGGSSVASRAVCARSC